MALLSITNLRTSPLTFLDPTGLYGTSIQVPGSATKSNVAISLPALAAIEPQLILEATASNITYTIADDPASQADNPPEVLKTVLVTPYNAVAGDQDIVTNLTIAGAVSVVLSAAAPVAHRVTVVDGKGDAGANNVTVTVAGGGTINGGASSIINTNRGFKTFLKIAATAWLQVA